MLRSINHGHMKLQNGYGPPVPPGLVISPATVRRHLLHFAILLLVSSVAIMEGVLILHGFLKDNNRLYNTCLAESGFDSRLGGRTLRRCSVMQSGGSTRCKLSDVALRKEPLPLRIYQQYHNKTIYPWLYDGTSELYRGLAQAPDVIRQDMDDVDATAHLELLKDSLYQNQLCEYSGFFALLAGGFVSSQPEPYIGFQSWKAKEKDVALQCRDEVALVNSIDEHLRREQDAFFFWACPRGPKHAHKKPDFIMRFYWGCDYAHNECLNVFRAGFSTLFGSNPPEGVITEGVQQGLPPIPDELEEWAYMSYFAMPTARLASYLRFAALFFAALDDKFYDNISNGTCPHHTDTAAYSEAYQGQHCFCFVMERLVNVWVYHSGLPMMYVDLETGRVREVHSKRKNYTNAALKAWFSDENMRSLRFDTADVLARRNGRHLIERLLPRDFAFARDGLGVLKYTVRDKLAKRNGQQIVHQVLQEIRSEAAEPAGT